LASLDKSLISNRSDGLGEVRLGGDMTSLTGLDRKSLQDNLDCNEKRRLKAIHQQKNNVLLLSLTTSLSGFLALASVLLDTVQEFLTALGVLDVLNTDVDTLLQVTVANALVNDDTDSRLGNVVDDTSATELIEMY
jgi:hypothetical protein